MGKTHGKALDPDWKFGAAPTLSPAGQSNDHYHDPSSNAEQLTHHWTFEVVVSQQSVVANSKYHRAGCHPKPPKIPAKPFTPFKPLSPNMTGRGLAMPVEALPPPSLARAWAGGPFYVPPCPPPAALGFWVPPHRPRVPGGQQL